MALANITKKKKKPVIPRRPKTGVAAIPLDHKRGFDAIKWAFHYEVDGKDSAKVLKSYITKNYSKDDAKAAFAMPEYKFTMFSHYAATAHILLNDAADNFGEKFSMYPRALKDYIKTLIEEGKTILAEKSAEARAKSNVIPLSPQQRLMKKVNETIMVDLDELEDAWIQNEKTTIEVYELMKKHDLKGAAVPMVTSRVEAWLSEYKDAYDKTCDQAVEGYSHITRRELKRRITVLQQILSELESFKSAQKAQRKPRVKKPKAADKQVAKVKYKKEDAEFKIASIDPTAIVGANKLFVFNTKYRQLMMYSTDSVNGFEVSGTSIKNFYPEDSIKITVRANKVDEVVKTVLKKTPLQIVKYIDTLSGKPSVPNGRLNEETVLLRAV